MIFTEKKFLSLALRKQHKCAGEHLRMLYEKGLAVDAHYRQMEGWLGLMPVEGKEEMADRFHLHMQEAAVALQEHNLLVKRFDTLSDAPYLPISIYLEGLRSAFNIGNILRTVEAFRLGTVVFSEDTPGNDHPKVIKTAMGAASLVPCKRGKLISCPRPLIALETVGGAPSVFDFSFPDRFTLILGNEEYGLKEETVRAADHVVQIPLSGCKNSLNVASAFAIVAAQIKSALSVH